MSKIDFTQALQHLNGMTADEFLRDYWQKKPLLIRNAFPKFQDPEFNPLSPDELAGLAMEKDINSRLIFGSHRDDRWKLEYGPFSETVFATLPESHWSLLVSDIEKHLPDFQKFIQPFRFIPDWRIDDLMVSYAPKGGSVGRHTDEYDVFLLQTAGQRRWQIEESRTSSDIIDGLDLRLLKDFSPTQDWVLNPGDMLYLPPGIAHYGVAENDCMTWSIGFRAPSWQHLIQDLTDTVTEKMDESQRYDDGDLELQNHPAEIAAGSLDKVRQQLNRLLQLDDKALATWFGTAVSQQACEFPIIQQEKLSRNELIEELSMGRELILSPYVRLCFSRTEDGYIVFIDGQSSSLNSSLIEEISQRRRLTGHDIPKLKVSPTLLKWLCKHYENGYWVWEDNFTHEIEDDEE